LYLVNKKENEIYKFSRSENSFGSGTPWLKENIDLSNSVDVSIDGQIYVLNSNGEIIKLLKGEQKELKLEKVDPLLERATSFYVSDALKFIYILEPLNKRLVIFDKTGEFVTQYTSNQFTDLKDFAVDEDSSTLYFLNGSSVLKTKTSHI